ncbi:hypothetical protein [Bifidobacterium catulorum]|uniref:Uncharacterized protein n=1 Tax=Bifidobacterium catulorum TaxID=1630173 RepID=A0A2U2MTX7_9BIFI|nr:hypothetical protein [Bifidobacterium catulorum]PWG60285.1 hypothetical protein DF200_03535 [Bifidobacterium catulorum]
MSFDSSYTEKWWDRFARPSSAQLSFAFQTSSSKSTHIEINPIRNTKIAAVEWDVKGDDPKCDLRSSIASGRVHISASAMKNIPLLHLRVTLLNKVSTLWSNAAWSLLFLLFSIFGWTFSMGWLNGFTNYYSPENVLAGLAVFLTLWVARRINAMEHSVSQELTRYPNLFITVNLLVSAVSYFCGGQLYHWSQDAAPTASPSQGALRWLMLTLAVGSLLLSVPNFHALWMNWRYRHGRYGSSEPVRKESFLMDVGSVPLPKFNMPGDANANRGNPLQRWIDRHDREAEESTQTLLPSEHGPYSVLEWQDYRDCAMNDRRRFVEQYLWKR